MSCVCRSGRLMRDRSQSSFSVSYKNMKKSPSLQSLDNISIDSYLMEDGDAYGLLERGGATRMHSAHSVIQMLRMTSDLLYLYIYILYLCNFLNIYFCIYILYL